jgi:ATP-binding cassette subfamily F protein uup
LWRTLSTAAFDDIKKTAHQRIDKDEIDIPIKMERLGTKILELHHMGKSFGDTKILTDFSYHFKRKERVGIVGQNGAGKTTFLNLIQGKETLDKGKVVVGETIVFGYYSQELIQVDPDKRVIEVIKDIAEFIPLEKGKQLSAGQLLERFLFPRDAHYQYVHKLSGGEKRRLKLLTVLMSNPNFLILDEPTNDLDIFVMSVLEEYLQLFEGCLIVVSHDRYFMDKMVDHLFVFEGDGEIKDIIGNYTDYRKNQKQEARELKNAPVKEVEVKEEPKMVEKPVEKRKLSFKEKQEYDQLPNEIERLEEKKEKLTLELSDASKSNQQIMELGNELAIVVAELEQKSDRWLELAEFV